MNEQDNNTEQEKTDSLVDLELDNQQEEETRGGSGATGAGKVQVQDFHFVAK